MENCSDALFVAAVIVAFSPHRRGILKKNAIVPQKGDEKFPLETEEMERGVKGMLPLGCLPLWGREGVTFIAF